MGIIVFVEDSATLVLPLLYCIHSTMIDVPTKISDVDPASQDQEQYPSMPARDLGKQFVQTHVELIVFPGCSSTRNSARCSPCVDQA